MWLHQVTWPLPLAIFPCFLQPACRFLLAASGLIRSKSTSGSVRIPMHTCLRHHRCIVFVH